MQISIGSCSVPGSPLLAGDSVKANPVAQRTPLTLPHACLLILLRGPPPQPGPASLERGDQAVRGQSPRTVGVGLRMEEGTQRPAGEGPF